MAARDSIPPASSADASLFFGDFRLVPSRRALYRGDAPVRVNGRAFDILQALVERPGELVSKEELIARAWPHTFVEDGNLRVQIVALRKLLGEAANGQPYVENVVGRGYSFVAPVTSSAAAPQPAAAPSRAGRLPALHSRLIGRDAVLHDLVELMTRRRLLTLTGLGGMGKTALAVAAARELTERFVGRVHFLDLAAVSEPDHVPVALGLALNLPTLGNDPVSNMLGYLQQGPALLVLDICEHVIDHVAQLVQRLLHETVDVHILATSREALRVESEWVYRLEPLAVPPLEEASAALPSEAVAAFPAVQLFIERAGASMGGLTVDAIVLNTVADICRRLDGIPLAIELAAGRASFFGVHGLGERLENCFDVLTGGRRTALPRQQTLRATLDWSHDVLSRRDRAVFRRLSVFPTSFSLDWATEVAYCPQVSRADVVDSIANLVAKSLVSGPCNNESSCYRMLATTRAYAQEKLVAAGEQDKITERYSEQLIQLLETHDKEQLVARHGLPRFGEYLEHIGVCLDWAFGPGGNVHLGQRMCALSAPLWHYLSLMGEYRVRLEQALAAGTSGLASDPALEMELQLAYGETLVHAGVAHDPQRSAALARALELAQQGMDRERRLKALCANYADAICRADYQAAIAFANSYGVESAHVDSDATAFIHASLLARVQHFLGMHEEAHRQLDLIADYPQNAITHCPSPYFQLASGIGNHAVLARILWMQGHPERAMQIARDCLEQASAMGHAVTNCHALWLACSFAIWSGDRDAAYRHADELRARAARSKLPQWEFRGRAFQAACHTIWQPHHPERESLAVLARSPYCGDWQIDFMATLHPELLTPRAIVRAEEGLAGWCQPEVLRAWGESQLRFGNRQQAELLLLRALQRAREQRAAAWELRAATSLARLWQGHEREAEAQAMLRAVLERYTEGQHTADLVAGRALL
jgi:predicted ATPase/DNA-binding winged helix-turn-helix (wHTH) protein